jgi:hypothetical protein
MGISITRQPQKGESKKPCLHLLYPMNKTFAEGESNEKGFLLCREKDLLTSTHVILATSPLEG